MSLDPMCDGNGECFRLEQELATLRAALKGLEPYLRHAPACHIATDEHGEYTNCYRPLGGCTCGLADRLAALLEGQQ